MLQSMTGYGKSMCELETKNITIEVKSLNSKQLDLNLKIPGIYKEKELAIRNELSKRLERGKIEVFMCYELTAPDNNAKVNKEIVKDYFNQINSVANELGVNFANDAMTVLMRLPDVLKVERKEIDEEEWSGIMRTIHEAMDELLDYRKQEGSALQKDILKRVGEIQKLLGQIGKFEIQRMDKVKTRILTNLNDFTENKAIDENRFEQELIYYLEKYDITEEKVRLKNHCKYFLDTVGTDEYPGKKLGFISQEMGREINTIGSKANDSDVQQIVVQMKDELEKIKEQLLNTL